MELNNTERGLLDIFAANAPSTPPSWFKPQMPTRPSRPNWAVIARKNGVPESDINHCIGGGDLETPEINATNNEFETLRDASDAWDAENTMQRVVQWPYHYALLQIKERRRIHSLYDQPQA